MWNITLTKADKSGHYIDGVLRLYCDGIVSDEEHECVKNN